MPSILHHCRDNVFVLTFTAGAALIIRRPLKRSENAAETAAVVDLVLKATLLASIEEFIGKRIIINVTKNNWFSPSKKCRSEDLC